MLEFMEPMRSYKISSLVLNFELALWLAQVNVIISTG